MTHTQTTLYTKPGCQGCRMTKRYLDQHDIAYETVDVSEQPEAAQTVTDLGYMALPVVVTADGHWSGFQPDRLAALATQNVAVAA